MKKFYLLTLLLISFIGNVQGQDWVSLFIGSANKYASVELSDYKKQLCVEYKVKGELLDEYYNCCGKDWGNVGIILEISHTTGKKVKDVWRYYNNYHKYGWNRVLVEIGIKPDTPFYNRFYERIHHHHDLWDRHYKKYCHKHGKHHHKNHKYNRRVN